MVQNTCALLDGGDLSEARKHISDIFKKLFAN
jgi:hypothetical protein